MYRGEVPNVPGGEVGAADLMEALWQHLEYEDVGQEEEEAASDEESVGGSCSNPDPPGLLPVEDMDEDEVEVEAHEEDHEEDPTGLLTLGWEHEGMDEVKVEAHEEDHEEDYEEDGHVGRTKRITQERMNVGDKMDDYEYR